LASFPVREVAHHASRYIERTVQHLGSPNVQQKVVPQGREEIVAESTSAGTSIGARCPQAQLG
jgi:hypothetical protein